MNTESVELVTPADGVPSLRDASAVGVQVKSTSEGSRYVCILRSPVANMAARIFSHKASLRMEPAASGPAALPEWLADGMVEHGFKNHEGKYLSAHVDVLTYAQGLMTVGAIQTAVLYLLSLDDPLLQGVQALGACELLDVPAKSA